nr:hypothetical protein [uncultured Allomuricauda sp.]
MKNPKISIVAVLLFWNTLSFAQNRSPSEYLVLNTGDTIFGKVQYFKEGKVISNFYKKVRIIDAEGKRKKYGRKKVSSFKVDGSSYESFWLSQHSYTAPRLSLGNSRYDIDVKKGERHFLKVLSKGEVSHYELEWIDYDNNDLRSMDLLKKEGDSFFIRADKGLFGLRRNVLINYFSNCPLIKEAIKEKKIRTVGQVVGYYGNHCVD